MDYVHANQEEFPFDDAKDIPVDDKAVYELFLKHLQYVLLKKN